MEIKILIIENTRPLSASIRSCLDENGFQISSVSYSEYLEDIEKYSSYALVVYPVSVSDKTEEIPRFSRPTLFLLEQNDLPRKMKGFRIGMEDYIAEPVNTTELLSRIHMLLRCAGIEVNRKLIFDDMELDMGSRKVTVSGVNIPLTAREFNILHGLLSNPEKTFTRAELMSAYWDEDCPTGKRAVDVYMTKLRDKFSSCHAFQIVTVHGVGYKAVLQ